MVRASVFVEKLGIPTSSIICEGFGIPGELTAAGLGMSGLPMSTYPGPINLHSTTEMEKNVATVLADQIIKNLLFYSSIKPPHVESVDLCAILEECVALSKEMFRGYDVDAEVVIKSRQECVVEADPYQLKEVFHNILSNSYESFSGNKGTIAIEVKPMKGGYIAVSFTDNGSGIKPEDMKEIPRPFITTKIRGIGLGLPVCYQIVHLHNGQMWVKSKVGKGTTVTVALPVRKFPERPEQEKK